MIEEFKLYNEDCKNTLLKCEDDFINLTITSPPYNVDLGNTMSNSSKYDTHNDNMPYDEYLKWLKVRFKLLYKKTVSCGRVCINISNQKNGRIPLTIDIVNLMKKIGWLPYTQIIWNKNHVSPRTAWGSFMSPSSPSFPSPFEFILVFCKDDYKLNHKGQTDLTKEEFIKFSLSMWNMTGASKKKTGHPASFPEELPYRCIKMFSYVNDIIYDPFAGIGTTLNVGKKLNRRVFGSELSLNYCDIFYKN